LRILIHEECIDKLKRDIVMKFTVIAVTAAIAFSSAASANSGQADRINEARSYPNKTIETQDVRKTCSNQMENHKEMHEQMHSKMSKNKSGKSKKS